MSTYSLIEHSRRQGRHRRGPRQAVSKRGEKDTYKETNDEAKTAYAPPPMTVSAPLPPLVLLDLHSRGRKHTHIVHDRSTVRRHRQATEPPVRLTHQTLQAKNPLLRTSTLVQPTRPGTKRACPPASSPSPLFGFYIWKTYLSHVPSEGRVADDSLTTAINSSRLDEDGGHTTSLHNLCKRPRLLQSSSCV